MTAIAILGEYTPAFAPHAATSAAVGCLPFVEAAVACTKVRNA
jgi:hypothetical protein